MVASGIVPQIAACLSLFSVTINPSHFCRQKSSWPESSNDESVTSEEESEDSEVDEEDEGDDDDSDSVGNRTKSEQDSGM